MRNCTSVLSSKDVNSKKIEKESTAIDTFSHHAYVQLIFVAIDYGFRFRVINLSSPIVQASNQKLN